MTLATMFDELGWRAPAQLAVRAIRIRERLELARIRYLAIVAKIRAIALTALLWLAGIALTLLYLLVCSYIDREDFAAHNDRLRAIVTTAAIENARLKAQVTELTATRTQKLIYLIEAESTKQAKEKLSRLAMMVAADHFDLQESTREKK